MSRYDNYDNKERRQYDGFLINNVIYLIAMYIASLFPFVMRTFLSFIVKTPSIISLRADATHLFNEVYPILGFFSGVAFFAGAWICCYWISYRIGYKRLYATDKFKMKMQLIIPSVLISVYNLYNGFADGFSGVFGFQYWYPAAWLSGLFGGFDKSNILDTLDKADLTTSRFVIKGLANNFNGLTVTIAVIYSVAFAFVCYYARKKGEAKGIDKAIRFKESLKSSQ